MANFNFNRAIIAGRMTADPELKNTTSGIETTSFTVAINRPKGKDGTEQADFINVVAWRQTAEFVVKYFKKGSSVCVVGKIKTRSWTDNNGQKHYATEVVADEVNFVDSKTDSAPVASGAAYIPDAYSTVPTSTFGAPKPAQNAPPQFEQVKVGEDDDLPF